MQHAPRRLTLLTMLLMGLTGCAQKQAPSTSPAKAPSAASITKPAAKSAASLTKPVAKSAAVGATTTVARIVFVDQKEACACTMKRIEGSWKAIIAVLGFPPEIDVERIHMDTQEAQAAPYKKMKPVMVAPGIYFLDGQGKLAEMLQGEVTADQIRKALGRST